MKSVFTRFVSLQRHIKRLKAEFGHYQGQGVFVMEMCRSISSSIMTDGELNITSQTEFESQKDKGRKQCVGLAVPELSGRF